MAEHVSKVIEILNKSGEKYTLHFTPRVPKNRRPRSLPYLFHYIDGNYVKIPYGYYEIKDSPLGSIMMCLMEDTWVEKEDNIYLKARAIKWSVSANYLYPAVQDEVYKFIHRMPVIQSGLSEKKADKLFDAYCDFPVPELAKNIEPPKTGSVLFESADEVFATFEAIRRVNTKRPFDLSDFAVTDSRNNFQR